ncbi:MAG: hypothetical protein PHU61_02785 [Candidatus Absconditabacteria bacterium]|nr:hypothetical protein [Candidatus Absconditabacteria bacterium]MDD3868661.1 hypothetical protein [Candidatus Absconditabacteria bacterium]MDD4714488.1 hypothetical protein [Candidatus Absconditabacteria bacterium]
MHISIDEQNLLCCEDSSLHTGKRYQQFFQGFSFQSENKHLFVSHKKTIKLLDLKDLGSGMGVFFCLKRDVLSEIPLSLAAVQLAAQIFDAWDEEEGKKYYFLPYFPTKEVEEKSQIFTQLKLNISLRKDTKGVLLETEEQEVELESIQEKLSFLFGLTLLWGKFEAKGAQLNAIKFHIPLFGQYLKIQEQLENILEDLQAEGIFLQSSSNNAGGKISYQITSNDYELLEIFAEWYKEIENFSQITKRELALQAVAQLKEFIGEGNFDNASEIVEVVNTSLVKVLIKS